tara:strand:+ start:371 stop:3274 length:2904 start_codon:yes stop_codon:yes gene_type:complete
MKKTLFILLLPFTQLFAQENVVEITALDSVYEENFDALSTHGTLDSLTGWYVNEGLNILGILSSSNGTGIADAGAYNFGSSGSSDRALGGRSDILVPVELIWVFKNSTGRPINKFELYYKGEQWYGGISDVAAQALNFSFGIGTTIANISYTDYDFDFTNPKGCNKVLGACVTGKGALNGNLSANSDELVNEFELNTAVQNGEYFAMKWEIDGGLLFLNSHGLALDDLGFIPYNDTAFNWYALGTDFDAASNWTKYPNRKDSFAKPRADSPKGFDDTTANFIIDEDIAYTGDFELRGNGTRVVVKEGVNFTLGSSSSSVVNAHIILNKNATFTSNLYENSGSVSLQFDTIHEGSTVIFDSNSPIVGSLNIPPESYANLIIRDSDGNGAKSYGTTNEIIVRESFLYEPSESVIGANELKVRFEGNSVTLKMPNYSGENIFSEFTIGNGTTLYLDSLSNSAINSNALKLDADVVFESASMLTLTPDQTLILNSGSFAHDGVFVLDNDASLIINDGITVSGSGLTSITRNQSVSGAGITNHWSSPVSGATLGVNGTVAGNKRWLYLNGEDDNSDYVNMTSDITIPKGRGCTAKGNLSSTFVANTPSELYYGSFIYHADAEHDNDADDAEYYLVGNPYSSGLSAVSFITENSENRGDILGTIYVFNQVNEFGAYSKASDNIAVNLLGASDPGITPSDSTLDATNIEDFSIASGQGFLVVDKTRDDDQIDIAFTPSMQIGLNNNFKSSENQVLGSFWLMLNDGKNYKTTLIGFANDATKGADDKYDAPKAFNGTALSIWSLIGTDTYEIQGIPPLQNQETRIPLGLYTPKVGINEIKAVGISNKIKGPIIMYDSLLGVYHDLAETSYSFTNTIPGEQLNRFYLFVKYNPNSTVGINDVDNETLCKSLVNVENQVLTFDNDVQRYKIINAIGQTIAFNESTSAQEFLLPDKGIYIIKTTTMSGRNCVNKLMVE